MTNTIHSVPRELLERVKSLCEYWFVRGQQQHMSESEHKTWHALGFGSSAFTELRALLSAPSPAGVDGLEVVGHIDSDDDVSGSYAVFKNDCDLRDGTDLARLSDAQAIIDGLRGEVEVMTQHANNYSRMFEECAEERDQQAQRIGELEGLLLRVQVSLSLDDTEWGYSGAEKYKLLADIRAALSAGKDSAS